MTRRCSNPNHKDWAWYGGRGINVCSEWKESFGAFFSYVGPRPSNVHSIDRINNDGNYEPGNVRWATREQQARNRRGNRLLTIRGETKTLIEWSIASGTKAATISDRLKKGWGVPRAVHAPTVNLQDRAASQAKAAKIKHKFADNQASKEFRTVKRSAPESVNINGTRKTVPQWSRELGLTRKGVIFAAITAQQILSVGAA